MSLLADAQCCHNRIEAEMPKKMEPELTPEEQFKRFQEATKEHEIERAFDTLAKAPKTKLGAGGLKTRRQHKPV
jgi:hypothetical protein